MANSITYLPYTETGYFSTLVNHYVTANPELKKFYTFTPDAAGIAKAIGERAKYPVNRKLLVDTLSKQYASLSAHEKVSENIAGLANENTFTVCTAHQPNLMTGYLYFVYKILHAIKLAEELGQAHPAKKFVPVYYMGSEDNDLEELGTFRFNGDKYIWDGGGQTGAVGRMQTNSLKPLLHEVFKFFGPPVKNCELLKETISKAYFEHETIGSATQYLVNELFGKFGLVVLDPDEAGFKSEFRAIMEDDLLNQTPNTIINDQIGRLEEHYKIQAQPRAINLFYLKDDIRERIEKKGDKWHVLDTDIVWGKDELIAELHEHPRRFSPNVMLRGMFQEMILPDVAFIGGGAEVAYWLQLQTLFAHYKVFYPVILLRQSALWIQPLQAKLRSQLGLAIKDIFKPEVELIKSYVSKNSGDDWQTDKETTAIEKILGDLKQKAAAIDPTLRSSADAALAKMKRQLLVLEKKMLRAEKRKMQVHLSKITRLKNALFPGNGLQERVENFSEYYLAYGPTFFDVLAAAIKPLNNEFLVIEDNS